MNKGKDRERKGRDQIERQGKEKKGKTMRLAKEIKGEERKDKEMT